ncbi:MAG: DUF2207 domain-containing protein [Eubacteriales bacterium]|nr:DUF2207 domain-containing protein [Eubacteriales bacterium]
MKWGRIIAIIFCVMVLFGLNLSFASAESYVTKNFDVQLDLYENNSFVVKEVIKVEFTEARHGIYRYIPYTGTTTRQVDGKTVLEKYRLKIPDVHVEGYQYDTMKENGNLAIQIGSEDLYVEGPQEYRITYRCTFYDDENEAFDSLYWNIIPQEWTTPIEAAAMTVHMPKQFDPNMAEFIAGAYGYADMEAVDWFAEGTTMTANTTRILNTGEGVTLNIILPEGYFTGEKTTAWMQWLMMLLIIAAPVLSFVLWFLFGRDPRVVRTVEFYAPEGVNPAELGYIIDGAVDSKDIVSLIIYWANGGYLTIREDEEKQFTLIKKKDLPASVKTYEYTMFQGLFDNREQVALEELKEDFYGTFEATKGQLRANFTMKKENRIFTQSSIGARALGALLMLLPVLSLAIFGAFLNKSDELWTIVAIPVILLAVIGFSVFITVYDRKDSLSKAKLSGLRFLGIVTLAVSAALIMIFS